ncbi:hypothetical protein RO3G_12322 [Rhizopus delemar RA 99-880]|uniref:Uncharacterized protein n=1 Tax=Rhizopus delemar (strain RA 99-880 / ATCC MYA-4621 / FGSC 9543 / NRRL 43880) TaxID=246409 RepID=I1CGN1_RHIO9|nr:hypothetical protein RO3G_12322 [Rhizopus delemar RA 99-880]|eukprot:EIE87611.1 hypothetical protein RO3G_12322 [Rhizopus delemar RA 99-880]
MKEFELLDIRKITPISFHDMAEFLDKEQLNMFVENGFLVDEQGIVDDKIETYVPRELLSQWTHGGGIRPTKKGLQRIDYILPRLLKEPSE